MVPGWYYLVPPSSNIYYPLRFTRYEVLSDNDETLPVPQWPGELNYGLQHQQKIIIMFQHAETRTCPLYPLNILPYIYGAYQWIWDPCV